MTTNKDVISSEEEPFDKIKESFFQYAKIIGLSFILPIWISIIINGGAILGKIASWFNQDIQFWTINEYLYKTGLILMIPAVYVFWFYYLAIKKILLQLHEDFFKHWNIEIGNLAAESLLDMKTKGKDHKTKFDLDVILMYLNRKLSELPNILEWIGRKLINKIPFVQFANSYDVKDLDNNNKEGLAKNITDKINEFTIDLIDSIVPGWTKFIIPINLILLFWYLRT